MIIYGKRMFGTCDVVPELFYVGTFFFHVDYIPLFPVSSHLILGKNGTNYQTIKLRMHPLSVLLTWLRTATFITAIFAGIYVAYLFDDPPVPGAEQGAITATIALAICSAALYAFLMIVPRKRKPSYQKACAYAKLVNLSDTGWAALNVQYGRGIDVREP